MEENSFSLSDFWKIIKRQGWIVAITLVVGIVAAIVYSATRPKQYSTDFLLVVGIVGDTWLHNPMQIEERCRSRAFLGDLSRRLGGKYSAAELDAMINTQMILTPVKGATRDVRITVTAESAQECYDVAVVLGEVLVEIDRPLYEATRSIYAGYLDDLRLVMTNLEGETLARGAEEGTSIVQPNMPVVPLDEDTDYSGSNKFQRLFPRTTDYKMNPYLISGVALLEQVYIETYLKTNSPLYSQPTLVLIPPAKPAKPQGHSTTGATVGCIFVALALGITLAAINHRIQQSRVKT